jgi:hypothetical protein
MTPQEFGKLPFTELMATTSISQYHALGWTGVDLDGTLAYYDKWRGVDHIGAPIPAMVKRVKAWLEAGKYVKIFTARAAARDGLEDAMTPIYNWCHEHLGVILEVTNVKDMQMAELWDDRAVQVVPNTGEAVESWKAKYEKLLNETIISCEESKLPCRCTK